MSSDGLRVHHDSLAQSADQMDRTFSKVQDALADLEKALDPLQTDFSGEAQLAYRQAKDTWNKEMAGMAEILTRTSNAVRTANGDYMTADIKGAQQFLG